MTNVEGMTKPERSAPDEDAFWGVDETLVVREEPATRHVYDLEEWTARFGESVIDFAKTIPQSAVTTRLISQLVGAAGSVGANYVEADDAVSKKEFLKNVPERSSRNETLSSHGSRGARAKTESANDLVRSKRIASNFFEDLEERKE